MKARRCLPIVFLSVVAALTARGADEPRPLICRIMPVGDSITEGGRTFSCYRYPLLKKLTDAGYRADWKTDTVEDKVHPNAQGAEKMADRWFAALTPILEKQP